MAAGGRRRRLRALGCRAGNADAAEAAVAAGVLLEVALVIFLGRPKFWRVGDLRRDAAMTRRRELALVRVARRFGGAALLRSRREDRRGVLRADVVALAVALRRVVVLPEDAEQLVEAHLGRFVGDLHHLGGAGAPAADLAIRRCTRGAARVADRGRHHARRLPELALGAPEAAHPEQRGLAHVGRVTSHLTWREDRLGRLRL